MRRNRLTILVCLASEVLIILGVFLIVCVILGITKDLPPGPRAVTYGKTVLVFSLLTPVLLILTRVMMLRKSAGTEYERKTDIDALCEHLRRIGLDATVESKRQEIGSFRMRIFLTVLLYVFIFMLLWVGLLLPLFIAEETPWMLAGVGIFILGFLMLLYFDPYSSSPTSILNYAFTYGGTLFMGSVRVANRNIDLIELQQWSALYEGWTDTGGHETRYGCFFVVQAKVEGLEDRLKAESRAVKVKKGFLGSETVGFQWEGKELAQVLNSDASLKDLLCPADKLALLDKGLIQLPNVETKPCREHECVRIRPKEGYNSPESSFPTIETFEAYDRIAQHVRSIAARAAGVKNR